MAQIDTITIGISLDLPTFDEAKRAGEAMHDAWEAQCAADTDGNIDKPPFERDDAAWGNLWMLGLLAVRKLVVLS